MSNSLNNSVPFKRQPPFNPNSFGCLFFLFMHIFKDKTLLDYLFANQFNISNEAKDFSVEIINPSMILNKFELSILKKKIMYQCFLYKTEPFYILLSPDENTKMALTQANRLLERDSANNPFDIASIQNTFQLMFKSIKDFYYDVSLKNLEFTIKENKIIDFSTLPKDDKSIYGYAISLKLKIKDSISIDAVILIPIKLLRFLIFFLTDKDITKLQSEEELINHIENLEMEFVTAKYFFPFKASDFFNSLNEDDFRQIIQLLFSSNMISYDMLFALSRVIENGTDRVMNSISKNLKNEFVKNVQEKANSYDSRWVEVANYHLLCNVKILLEKKRFESNILNQFKKILEEIEFRIIEKIINKNPFLNWVNEAKENKKLLPVFSICSLKTVAIALSDENEDIMLAFKDGISKRAFEDLTDEVAFIKRNNPSHKEQILAKYTFAEEYSKSLFNDMKQKEKNLINWIRFKSASDLNHSFSYIGPIDFTLGIITLEEKAKNSIVRNLTIPAKYFVEDLLIGKIKLNTPYGKTTLQIASEKLAQELFKLGKIGRIEFTSDEASSK